KQGRANRAKNAYEEKGDQAREQVGHRWKSSKGSTRLDRRHATSAELCLRRPQRFCAICTRGAVEGNPMVHDGILIWLVITGNELVFCAHRFEALLDRRMLDGYA